MSDGRLRFSLISLRKNKTALPPVSWFQKSYLSSGPRIDFKNESPADANRTGSPKIGGITLSISIRVFQKPTNSRTRLLNWQNRPAWVESLAEHELGTNQACLGGARTPDATCMSPRSCNFDDRRNRSLRSFPRKLGVIERCIKTFRKKNQPADKSLKYSLGPPFHESPSPRHHPLAPDPRCDPRTSWLSTRIVSRSFIPFVSARNDLSAPRKRTYRQPMFFATCVFSSKRARYDSSSSHFPDHINGMHEPFLPPLPTSSISTGGCRSDTTAI